MSSFAFWWEWNPYTLPSAAEDIGDVNDSIVSSLPQLGYGNIVHAADVTANKNNFAVGIVFLFTSGTSFYQVVNVVTDLSTGDAAAEGAKILNLIKNLKFL
jgi:hypothetical protein